MMRVASIALAGLLAGCSTTMAPAPSANAGQPPVGYRAAVVQSVKATFYDPYSIRDASISAPLYASAVFDGVTPFPRKGWIVCVRANAKNRMGGYIGLSQSVFVFDGEKIVGTLEGPDFAGQIQDHCKTAVYQPFAEIEAS